MTTTTTEEEKNNNSYIDFQNKMIGLNNGCDCIATLISYS